jgi:hypothetical protein
LGADAPVVANVVQWTARFTRDRTRVTRPGYAGHRYSYGPIQGEGTLRVVVNNTDATNPIPLGVAATMVLLEDSGQSYTFNASLFALTKLGVDSANGSQQWAEYAWTLDTQSNAALSSIIAVA